MKKLLISLAIAFVVLLTTFLSVNISSKVRQASKVYSSYTVVIDPGHGARDGGCIGDNGVLEKDLNLEYAKTLRDLLTSRGVKVVMTRTSDKALYDDDAKSKKMSEMKAREKVILNAKPDLVISIHMNSFSLKSARGAKVFYKEGSEPSATVAKYIHKSINSYLNKSFPSPSKGDYYILNCTPYTSVLVECGYLSNPEEELLLASKDYRESLMHSVFCGILVYLGINYY